MIFDGITEATADRAVSAGGKPFTAELYLDVLETMEFSFDENGEWQMPTMVLHPSMMARAQEQIQRLDVEPALKERLSAIVTKKKEHWRDREADRQLVD